MKTHRETVDVDLESEFDAADLSEAVRRAVRASGVSEGTVVPPESRRGR